MYTTLCDAYVCTLNDILWNCSKQLIVTEDGELTYEKLFVDFIVESPNRDVAGLVETSPYQIKMMEAYADELVNGIDANFDYTYYDRLCKYGEFDADGSLVTINQVANIVKRLNEQPISRRAIANTRKPLTDDFGGKSTPCLQLLQCFVRDDQLHMSTTWRSRDILMGMPANMFAFNKLHNVLANQLELDVGTYHESIGSAHIYFKRDESNLKKFI